MRAKPPDQLNLRRPTVKCDVCGRKFLNAQALKSHHNFLHLKPDGKRSSFKKRLDTKQLKKKVVPVNMLKRVAPSPAAKQMNKTDVKANTSLAGKKPNERKAKFECPICLSTFSAYFTAFRHIQKNHCVNAKGEKVAPNSPLLVKPIRQEYCVTCDKQIRSTEKHECAKPVIQQDHYKCLSCNQMFVGLLLFQLHVKGLHEDGSQNYFFPKREEFTSWKKDLEDQTELKFVRLNNNKSKEVYHCSHQATNATAVSHLCPSIITVRDYKTGVHVCYYKEHRGHSLKSADLDKYSNHSISSCMQDSDDAKDDNDLYLQFKKLISGIVSDASKVDVTTLKELLGKAFEMTSVLKTVDGEKSCLPVVIKSLTDAQISSNLEGFKSKRKHSPAPKDAKKDMKKAKKDGEEKLIENGVTKARSSPALIKSVSVNKTLKNNNETKTDDAVAQKSVLQSPTSFNESYKNFVDQNFKTLSDTSTPKPKSNVRMSCDQPDTSTPKPKNNVRVSCDQPDTSTPKPKNNVRMSCDQTDICAPKPKNNVRVSCDQPDISTPKPKSVVRKKEVVKTKIGQFKVKPSSLSPKDSLSNDSLSKDTKDVPVSPIMWKVKPDFKYEVKEQENDCNILILKI